MRNQGSTASSLDAAPSPIGPTIWSAGTSMSVDLDRARLVAAQAQRVPQRGLGLDVLAVDDEDRQVVVALEVRARRLDDVEVGEAARGRPRRLLAHLVAAVGALGPRGERVPEVRAGLGIGVRERPDLALVQRPDVLVDQLGRGAQHERRDRAGVHDVAHRRRGAAVAGQRLAGHAEGDVVLAQPAVLLGHDERQEAVLGEDLEVAPREQQLVVGALGVGAHLLLAEPDQLLAQLLLALGQDPVGIPVVAEAPEGLVSPRLVGHCLSLVGAFVVQICTDDLYRVPLRVSTGSPGRRQPSGATHTRQGASRRTRRAVIWNRRLLVSRRSRPEDEQARVQVAQDLQDRFHGAPRGHTEELRVDPDRGRPLCRGTHGVEVLLVREVEALGADQRERRRVGTKRKHVGDHERHPRLEGAVDRHPLRGRIDSDRHRRQHHGPRA